MRADPGHPAEQHDGEQRNRPDNQFELPGIFPIRQIERPLVGRTEPPGDAKGGDNGRDHDDEHDGDRIDEERRVAVANRAFRIEHGPVAATEEHGHGQRRQAQDQPLRGYLQHHFRAPAALLGPARVVFVPSSRRIAFLSMLRWSCRRRRMALSSRRVRHSRLEGTAHAPIVRSERLLGSGRLDNWTPMEPPYPSLEVIAEEVRACRLCRDAPRYGAPLPHEPRPAFQVSAAARLCIAGQAPGVRVHASGRPFTDPSGVRLRQWLGIGEEIFYDPVKVAIVSMGFCFPGLDAKGGDLPPRRECAETWRERLFHRLPNLELVLLVGQYAQAWHLDRAVVAGGLTKTVGRWRDVYRSATFRASCRSLIHRGGTTHGSSAIRGSSSTCCRRCAPTWRKSSRPDRAVARRRKTVTGQNIIDSLRSKPLRRSTTGLP